MKTIYIIIGIIFLIIIGWLIPIDGPFDITPEEVIQQYKRSKGSVVPIIKKKQLSEEIEYLQEEFQMQFLPIVNIE